MRQPTGEVTDRRAGPDASAGAPAAGSRRPRRSGGRDVRRSTSRSDAVELGVVLALVAVALAWGFSGTDYRLQLGIDVGLMVTLVYSWNVISGFTGYLSFGQVAFFGFGAFATALLMLHAGLSWYLASIVAGALAGVVSIPVGLVMLRLRGIYFALGMFGLVYVLQLVVSEWEFTGGDTGLLLPGELAQAEIFVAMTLAAVLGFGLNVYMSRSRFGLRARSVRDDEEAAEAMGVPTTRVKVTAFALSAVLPAVAGGFIAFNRSFIDADSVLNSRIEVETIVYAIAGGLGTLWGPLISTVSLESVGNLLADYPEVQLALFGVLIILVTVLMPGGVVSLFSRAGFRRRAIVGAPRTLAEPEATVPLPALPAESRPEPGAGVLVCKDVHVSFGGVQALRGVDLSVQRGETVFIIGANGAGKTTLFNAITSLVEPTRGSIEFNGRSVVKSSPHALAYRGLGRTFQIPRLFESLTVWENVFLAAMGGRRRSDAASHAEWVVRTVELEHVWLSPVSTLSIGHRRLVELARALALAPDLILLDEVMAGMTSEEVDKVVGVIRRMREYGVGAVGGIEHVIHAISGLADRIVVLEKGQVIAEGAPDDVLKDPEVVRAYIGEELFT